ncbi:MAG TPA: hypothetical protein VIE91_06100 [Methylophilaceae bacterium]
MSLKITKHYLHIIPDRLFKIDKKKPQFTSLATGELRLQLTTQL